MGSLLYRIIALSNTSFKYYVHCECIIMTDIIIYYRYTALCDDSCGSVFPVRMVIQVERFVIILFMNQ